jgi:hypothetical protein
MNLKVLSLLIIFSLPPVILAQDEKINETGRQILALINSLGADKFELREEAQSELIEMGAGQYDLIIGKCLESHMKIKDPEIRFRLKNILRSLVIKREFRQKGFVGISMQPNRAPLKIGNEVFLPIEIISVMPDLPAEKGGVNAGDLILKVDAKTCNEKFQTTEIVKYISAMKPGTVITFLLQSNGEQVTKEIVIAERPVLPNEPTIEEQQDEFFRNWLKSNLKKAGK